ncbi:MAG: ribonuclease E/G [Alphaproteobacteria bacterium]
MFYAIKPFLDELTVALLDEGKVPLTFYWIRKQDVNLGDIYVCRITQKMPNLKGYFAQIDHNRSIFLASKHPLEVGQMVSVIITKEARLGKIPQAKRYGLQKQNRIGLVQKGDFLYGVSDSQNFQQIDWTEELDDALSDSIDSVVPFADGARLIFEQTHAFWCIDVDSGSCMMDLPLLNEKAAVQIGKEIIKRNISGNILIDFIGDKRHSEVGAWKNILSRELCKSPVPYQLIGVSSMGNIELRRDRMRADTLSATRTISAICYDLFKKILKTPDKIASVQVSLEVYAALTSLYKETFDQVQAKTGDSIHISASSDVARFRLEYK